MFLQDLNSKLPANFISNREFCFFTETKFRPGDFVPDGADQWIFERSGIRTRAYLDLSKVGCGNLAPGDELEFVTQSLTDSLGEDVYESLQAIITVRSSPFHFVPGLSQRLLKNLNAHFKQNDKCMFTLDLFQPSTGFLSALTVIRGLPFQSILLVCSEILSPFINLKDVGTSMLFGDGVASVVLTKRQTDQSHFQLIDELFSSQSDRADLLKSNHDFQSFHMKGPELFRKVIPEFKRSAEKVLSSNGYSVSDIKFYLPHQANRRIIERAAHAIGFTSHQLLTNIERVGNLSSASIPLLLAEKTQSLCFNPRDRILLNTCGAGLSSGAAILEKI